MNLSWKTIVTSFGLMLGMLSPMLAYAGCSQGDLKGTWYAYALSVDSSSFNRHRQPVVN